MTSEELAELKQKPNAGTLLLAEVLDVFPALIAAAEHAEEMKAAILEAELDFQRPPRQSINILANIARGEK